MNVASIRTATVPMASHGGRQSCSQRTVMSHGQGGVLRAGCWRTGAGRSRLHRGRRLLYLVDLVDKTRFSNNNAEAHGGVPCRL